MSLNSISRSRMSLLLGVFILTIVTAFMLGRRSARPDRPMSGERAAIAGEHGEAGGGDEHAEDEAGEDGAIKFDREAMELAGLRVEPAAYRSLRAHLPVTGEVEPNLSGVVKITPRVSGKVISLHANVGDTVRAGQALAAIASADLAAAQAAYRQATARAAVAQRNLQRQQELARLGAFGRPRVEEARSQAAGLQGETSMAQSEVAVARNEVAEARSERAAAEAEVASAQSAVATAQSEVAQAEGESKALQAALAQAQTQVRVAKSRLERADLLLKEQLMSRQEWEQAQADTQRAEADVEAARANLAQGQARIASARSRVNTAEAEARAARGRLEQADTHIQTAAARQSQAEARLAAAQRRQGIASQSLSREEMVYKGGYMTSKEVMEAEAAMRQAQLEQQAAVDNIRLLGGTPGGGNRMTVSAAIGGRVTERSVTLGEMVTPEKALFTIVNLSSVWVQLRVYQKSIPDIRVGLPVRVTSDTAPGRVFTGVISYIGDIVDDATRTVKVRAVFQNTEGTLKPQSFVQGTIATGRQARLLAVPEDAVQTYEGKTVLFVQGDRPGEFEAKPVLVGEPMDGWVEIRSGLSPGDRVVVQGAFIVKGQAMKSELGHEH